MVPFVLALFPAAVFAESIAGGGCASAFSSIPCMAQAAGNLFGLATAALVGIAIIIYFFGIVRNLFATSSGDAKSSDTLRNNLLLGLLGLFVIFSIWGIIRLLGTSLFGTNNLNSLW